MCGRSVKAAAALALLALTPAGAEARSLSFQSGSPFGIGLVGGVESKPGTDVIAGSQTYGSNYSRYFAAEPFLEFVNVQIRLHAGWHFYPLISGSGSDSKGAYTESSDASSVDLGARILFAPYVAADERSRAYFVVGLNDSKVSLTNLRNYKGVSNSAKLSGSGTEVNGGVGYEFFLLQNYSLAIEGGYRSVTVSTLHYGTITDETGANVSAGATATNGSGGNLAFHAYAPYAQLVLNLNL
jgi:hypothetical protein